MALEADNYIVWNNELKDSKEVLNKYFAEKIQSALQTHPQASCLEITDHIGNEFKSFLVHENPVELYLMDVLREEENLSPRPQLC